ncbi:MAG: hypothetical protein WCF84_18060 [Anaerolineae bacterium]
MEPEPSDTRPDPLAVNRQGELTPEQRVMLNFLLEAQRLGAGLGSVVGVGSLLLFGCIFGWGLVSRAGWGFATEFFIFALFGLYSLWNARRALRRLAHFKRALYAGQVAHVDGQIAWTGRRYAIKVPLSEKLDLDFLNLPGAYRFYYVPFSGRVLSVERLDTLADARNCLLDALMGALRFDAAGLASNRMGRMSDAQRDALLRSLVLVSWGKILGMLVGGILFVLLVVNYQIGREMEWGWTAILAAIPPLLILGLLITGYRAKLADLREGRVQVVQGVGYHPRNSKLWQISYNQFKVSGRVTPALISGLRYRAFYLPRSRYLVSIEPLAFTK